MIKTIMRDPMFLAQKSENATEVDAQVVTDLLEEAVSDTTEESKDK